MAGTALGAGILLDVTVIRALLVPAVISLLRPAAWWLPGRRGSPRAAQPLTNPARQAPANGGTSTIRQPPPPVRCHPSGGTTVTEHDTLTRDWRHDWLLMKALHDAFRRDLDQLLTTTADGAAIRARWQIFCGQLHFHHTAEDTAMWPPVRAKLAVDPTGLALLDEMQAEHAQIDPILAALDEALWVTVGWTGSAAAPPLPGRCSIGPCGCRATGAAHRRCDQP